MINLKNLKSLFIEETGAKANSGNKAPEKEAEKEAVSPEEQETEETIVESSEPIGPPEALPENLQKEPVREHDPKIYNLLINAIESNNLDGFDYLEFKNSLRALANLPMDESTKFKSAFATASTMGLTIEKLLASADHYKGVLNNEKEKFRSQLEKKVNESVYSRDQDKDKLERMIQQKEARITALQEEVKQHHNELAKLNGQVDTALDKVEQMKDNFVFTYNRLMVKLDDDIQKINSYLVG